MGRSGSKGMEWLGARKVKSAKYLKRSEGSKVKSKKSFFYLLPFYFCFFKAFG
jgi:hypothetical protein